MPLSIVGTFAVMYLLGYSLNNLSLMALTLSVGFVVDDAIVMLENIVRHMELGEARMEAARRGSREIGFTIVSMTISLVSVFIPVLFMGGIVGRLLHEFSVTIAVAILVSGFVSLTLTPMLGSRFLSYDHAQRHSIFYNVLERFFQGMNHAYERSLLVVLRHRFATLMLAFATSRRAASGSSSTCRKASCPAPTAAFSTASLSPARTFRSIRWWLTSRPSRTSCRHDPNARRRFRASCRAATRAMSS